MDTSIKTVHPTVSATLSALTAVARARSDDERRAAQRQLKAADTALKKTVDEREDWLKRNWKRLDEYRDSLSVEEYTAKEAIYLAKCKEYEQMVDVLGSALIEAREVVTAPVVMENAEQGGLL